MFDFDDMIRDFAIAVAILFVASGAYISIYMSLEQSEYAGILAAGSSCVWVYISFRLYRQFKMWILRDEIGRKDFFLQHMPDNDPDRRQFIERRNKAIQQLDELRKG